jgi:hypothetical protein
MSPPMNGRLLSPVTCAAEPLKRATARTSKLSPTTVLDLEARIDDNHEGKCQSVGRPSRLRPRGASVYVSSCTSLFRATVRAEESQGVAGHWYAIRLTCQLQRSMSWEVRRRYRHFLALVQTLHTNGLDAKLPVLPPRLLLHTAAEQQRRAAGLKAFCEDCLSSPLLLSDPSVGAFFDLDAGLWQSAKPEEWWGRGNAENRAF